MTVDRHSRARRVHAILAREECTPLRNLLDALGWDTEGDEAVVGSAQVDPPGTQVLLAEVRTAVEKRDLKRLLATYDFSGVHQIHRDEEHMEWKGYFEAVRDGKVLSVKFVPLKQEYRTKAERDKARNGYKVGTRHYRPNIPVSGFVFIETNTVQFLHAVGLSRGGKLRLASTTVIGLKENAGQDEEGDP